MLLKDLQTLATKLATGTLFHVEKAGKAYSVDYSALAKAIIEEYADSTVGGSKQSVQAAIGALNSSSQSVLTIASGWNSDGNWCIKKAGVVEMYIQITGGTYSSGWNQVATLPEGYRPKYSFDSINLDNGSNELAADVKIQADGKVSVYKTETLSNNLRFHAVFFAA